MSANPTPGRPEPVDRMQVHPRRRLVGQPAVRKPGAVPSPGPARQLIRATSSGVIAPSPCPSETILLALETHYPKGTDLRRLLVFLNFSFDALRGRSLADKRVALVEVHKDRLHELEGAMSRELRTRPAYRKEVQPSFVTGRQESGWIDPTPTPLVGGGTQPQLKGIERFSHRVGRFIARPTFFLLTGLVLAAAWYTLPLPPSGPWRWPITVIVGVFVALGVAGIIAGTTLVDLANQLEKWVGGSVRRALEWIIRS
jgi:hypothetical protein